MIGLVLRLFGVFVVFFASTLPLFYTGNFFVGFSDILFQTAFFYAVELAPKSMGETLPKLFRVTDSTFEVFSPAILWLTLDMNAIFYALFITIGLGTLAIVFTPESPVYLLKKRKVRELNAALRQIGKMNCAAR